MAKGAGVGGGSVPPLDPTGGFRTVPRFRLLQWITNLGPEATMASGSGLREQIHQHAPNRGIQ